MHEVKAVVVKAKNEPAVVETILVPDPGPGEALVDVLTCGVCQTDHHYQVGGVSDDFPFLLGHEATGVVSALGEGVTGLAVGDRVILNWRAVCGECRACRRGEPWYCFATHNASTKMTLQDGTELTPALGIGAFTEKTLVAAGQCTKIDGDLEPSQYAAVGLLGCGVTAGLGAVLNTGALKRGETVAVFGCGGVGTAAVAGAKLGGATRIIAVDLDDEKLATAQGFGATDLVNSRNQDPVAAIQELTDGNGADLVIDAVGIAKTFQQAFEARDLAGRMVLVGVPDPGTTWEIPLDQVFGRGGSIKSAWYGDCLPNRDFPMFVDHYRLGNLDLDGFVSERISINDVEPAFTKMRESKVLRSVVELENLHTLADQEVQ
ncbi:S-(hydroxymethyl)mycothiol dehydrogenase [Kocuria sp. JC486]|uniref:S-(Hydroxymethyl)mycothiol dehydrogenase n=1 Tax=Kocuria soli TaxID=2485125 RepID=A0A3N4A3E2_9MICC|nr:MULTISPECIES: S-(hydroxymethyl)mycothiol dehydrogenase [Kocuria]NHU84581.1 S-(hydroxymethyl)mycothiol dehydrogenase [Kocuria sp. JC486]ROZ62991.1 S-(hydroxymethyl)mycothiol dehydrogenase [Kocuria soli]